MTLLIEDNIYISELSLLFILLLGIISLPFWKETRVPMNKKRWKYRLHHIISIIIWIFGFLSSSADFRMLIKKESRLIWLLILQEFHKTDKFFAEFCKKLVLDYAKFCEIFFVRSSKINIPTLLERVCIFAF